MEYLGIDSSVLSKIGGIHTATEISQQPEVWEQVWERINMEQSALQQFLSDALSNSTRILITGAGTSAFIGFSLRGTFQRLTGIFTEVVASTDIVSHPKDYFQTGIPTLMVSFARSGNSPESVAAVELADKFSNTCYHLIITCNSEGKLSNYRSPSCKYVFNLPKEANDQSLAMTSSYSGMLLAGILVAHINDLHAVQNSVKLIIKYARRILDEFTPELKIIAEKNFKRAVFLGSGPFYGTAMESHLKLQELSDGKVICKNDSFLGFRHGPKAIIDEATLVCYFFSNDQYAYQYEKDLVDDMRKGTSPMFEIGISDAPVPGNPRSLQLFSLSENRQPVIEAFLTVCYVLPAQFIAFYKSLHLGLMPDAPSVSGSISRVVQGVEIYSFTPVELKNQREL